MLSVAGIPKLRQYDLRQTAITRLCEDPEVSEETVEAVVRGFETAFNVTAQTESTARCPPSPPALDREAHQVVPELPTRVVGSVRLVPVAQDQLPDSK